MQYATHIHILMHRAGERKRCLILNDFGTNGELHLSLFVSNILSLSLEFPTRKGRIQDFWKGGSYIYLSNFS